LVGRARGSATITGMYVEGPPLSATGRAESAPAAQPLASDRDDFELLRSFVPEQLVADLRAPSHDDGDEERLQIEARLLANHPELAGQAALLNLHEASGRAGAALRCYRRAQAIAARKSWPWDEATSCAALARLAPTAERATHRERARLLFAAGGAQHALSQLPSPD